MPYEQLRIVVPSNRCWPCSCLLFRIGSQVVKIQESGMREMMLLGDAKQTTHRNANINK